MYFEKFTLLSRSRTRIEKKSHIEFLEVKTGTLLDCFSGENSVNCYSSPLKILSTSTAEAAPWASCVFETCY